MQGMGIRKKQGTGRIKGIGESRIKKFFQFVARILHIQSYSI